MRRIIGPALQNTSLDNNNNNNNLHNTTLYATNLASSTPTRSARTLRPRPHPHPHTPLQLRDRNVMMRVPPKSPLQTKSSNGNGDEMPANEKTTTARPFMPTLSAAGVKNSNRTPLTPRVAASVPPITSTPTPRLRPENRTPGSSRDDLSTPVSSFLSQNITPRSGSRKSRVDSANTTPTSTPTGTPAPQFGNEAFRIPLDSPYETGLGISAYNKATPIRPTVSFSPSLPDGGSVRGSATSNTGDAKFFFASDAKTAQVSRPPLPTKSSSSFFYASGEAIPEAPQSSAVSAVGSNIGEERSQPKFFHVNGTPDLQASQSPQLPPSRPASVIGSSNRMVSPRLPNVSPGVLPAGPRPTSPSKLNQEIPMNFPKIQSPVTPRPPVIGRGQSASSISVARRASIEGQRVLNHGRSASTGSTDCSMQPARKVSGESSVGEPVISPSSPLTLIATSVPVSTPEEIPDQNSTIEAPVEVKSPTKAVHSLERMNELAANARRERKVLDLEITNSSLAAINRTLEREMRKQTAELRRYRRLSRSGRLSIATTASLRTSMSTIDGVGGLSDMSEEEELEDEDEEEESDYSDESYEDGTLSPNAMAESDLRHRKRDEQRLRLDLSKHQQLLVDSQKMNQSLKRCLGWTEELINEGKKALEYKVRVSDVELGGRVLAPIDDDDGEEDANEAMSDVGAQLLKESRAAAAFNGTRWEGSSDGRDSGIEVDHARREVIETTSFS